MTDNPGHAAPHIQETHLPNIEISKVLGLAELLKNKGGKEDIYKLADELKMEFGDTLTVIRAAEMLKICKSLSGDVLLEPVGDKITKSKIASRKTLVRTQLQAIPVFAQLAEYLKGCPEQKATRSDVLEKIAEFLPNEHLETSFTTIVNWSRYAELFGYNDNTETFYIDQGN